MTVEKMEKALDPSKGERTLEQHVEQVRQWLENNVQVIAEPKSVILSGFSVDWERFSGDFSVSFDAVAVDERFSFGIDQSGKTQLYFPMFNSPLGAPASYAAIKLNDKTETAIIKGLRYTLPRVKAAGIDRKTGKETFYNTPVIERIDKEIFEQTKAKVTSGYSITISLCNL